MKVHSYTNGIQTFGEYYRVRQAGSNSCKYNMCLFRELFVRISRRREERYLIRCSNIEETFLIGVDEMLKIERNQIRCQHPPKLALNYCAINCRTRRQQTRLLGCNSSRKCKHINEQLDN